MSRSPEEVIGKLNNYYEQSKGKTEYQQGWNGKEKATGKWNPKRTRPQDVVEKENYVPYKKFSGPQPRG